MSVEGGRNRLKAIQIICVALCVLSPVAFTKGQDVGQDGEAAEKRRAIMSPEEALERALQITGFGPRMEKVPSAAAASTITKMVRIEDDNTPYLADGLNGREFWQVRLDRVDTRTPLAISRGDDRWGRRDFELTIDPTNGHVIRIQTVTRDTSLPPEASAASATSQLKEAGERYWGFVDSIPPTTFLQVLHAATGCAAPSAKEIIAQCVMYSRGDQQPRPVWIITTRGIPPFEISSRSHLASEKARSRASCVVDATSAEWLTMSLRPHPEYQVDTTSATDEGKGGEE